MPVAQMAPPVPDAVLPENVQPVQVKAMPGDRIAPPL